MDEIEHADEETSLVECSICGRRFRPDVLPRHTVICEKTNAKKRKPFDSGRQRVTGTEIPYDKVVKPTTAQKTAADRASEQRGGGAGGGGGGSNKAKWREQHENFIQSIRTARNIADAERRGETPPPVFKSAVPSDYKQCPHCGRNFNQAAAERHIPFCKEQTSRLGARHQSGSGSGSAQHATANTAAYKPARAKYQPPRPGGARAAGAGSGSRAGQRRGELRQQQAASASTPNTNTAAATGGGGAGRVRAGALHGTSRTNATNSTLHSSSTAAAATAPRGPRPPRRADALCEQRTAAATAAAAAASASPRHWRQLWKQQ